MTFPPDGERPRGEEPFEGIPPEKLERPDVHGDLPDLEPEFVEALREAAGEHEPVETEEPPEDGDRTVEFTAEEVSDARHEAADEQATEEGPSVERHSDEPAAAEEPSEDGAAGEVADAGEGAEDGEEAVPGEGAEAGDGDGKPVAGEGAEAGDGDGKPRRTVVIGGPAAQAPEAVPEAPTATAPAPVTATAATAGAPPRAAAPVGLPLKPPPEGDTEPAPKRKRLWLRFLIASVLIVASMAAATAASALYFLDNIAGKLGRLHGVQEQLLPPQEGQPENILIIGSDKRDNIKGYKGLSDTTILLRLDPNNHAIAMMSIPRDLKVDIPGVGISKFNAAYAYGGPQLTLRMVKQITGLQINHVVNVDFLGFIHAVNAIGCVYVQVDRRYYHSNAGLPPSLQYSEINIEPGYQKLCGDNALAYVRYRHTDTDLVRSARQQEFLRDARQQVPAQDIFINKRQQLLDIFTRYTTSDISSGETLLQVLKLFVAARGAPIHEVHFPAILHPSFVTASPAAIASAVAQFRGIRASGGPRGTLDLPRSSGQTGIVPQERKRAKAAKSKSSQNPLPTPSPGNDGLVDASFFSREIASKVAAKAEQGFPIFYPTRLPQGTIYPQVPRFYGLFDNNGHTHSAYAEVLQLPTSDYFDIEGVHGWSNPPILNNPSQTVTIGGRQYEVYLDGDRVRLVSWHQGGNSYWVYNSLLQTLSNDQMLGIARSVGKLKGQQQPHGHGRR